MAESSCLFNCSNPSAKLITCGVGRIETVKTCSIRRGDSIHSKLEGLQSFRCHKSCVSTYTSELHIKRYLSKRTHKVTDDSGTAALKIPKRTDTPTFIFKEHCLLCGEPCLSLDPRNPIRWREVSQC